MHKDFKHIFIITFIFIACDSTASALFRIKNYQVPHLNSSTDKPNLKLRDFVEFKNLDGAPGRDLAALAMISGNTLHINQIKTFCQSNKKDKSTCDILLELI